MQVSQKADFANALSGGPVALEQRNYVLHAMLNLNESNASLPRLIADPDDRRQREHPTKSWPFGEGSSRGSAP